MPKPKTHVGACECCGATAGPRVSLYLCGIPWGRRIMGPVVLCHACKDKPLSLAFP